MQTYPSQMKKYETLRGRHNHRRMRKILFSELCQLTPVSGSWYIPTFHLITKAASCGSLSLFIIASIDSMSGGSGSETTTKVYLWFLCSFDIHKISFVDSRDWIIPAQSVLYGPPIGLVFPVTMPSCWFLSTGVTWNSYQELSDKFVMAKNWYRPPEECGTSGHSFHNTVWNKDVIYVISLLH